MDHRCESAYFKLLTFDYNEDIVAIPEVVPNPRAMCEEPARWLYIGIPPLPPEKARYKWQTIQTRLYLCLDHGRELWKVLGAYRTRPNASEEIELRRLDKTVLRFTCKSCLSVLKYEFDSHGEFGVVSVTKGPPDYCPQCGVKGAPAKFDPERDYWDMLSEAFNNMDVTLLKILYEEWAGTHTRYDRFRDYVNARLAASED